MAPKSAMVRRSKKIALGFGPVTAGAKMRQAGLLSVWRGRLGFAVEPLEQREEAVGHVLAGRYGKDRLQSLAEDGLHCRLGRERVRRRQKTRGNIRVWLLRARKTASLGR